MELSVEFDFVDKFGFPHITIMIDDKVLYCGDVKHNITVADDIPDGNHILSIIHHDKKISDYDATHDKHVIITRILFDGVDLDQTKYCPLTHRGRFYPEYEQSYIMTCQQQNQVLPEFISPNHYLGHNGTWVLDFTSPAYDWIIKEQKPSGINLEDTIFSSGADTLSEIKSFFNV